MGLGDFLSGVADVAGNIASTIGDAASSVGGAAVDLAVGAKDYALDKLAGATDFIAENPGSSLLVAGAALLTGGGAATSIAGAGRSALGLAGAAASSSTLGAPGATTIAATGVTLSTFAPGAESVVGQASRANSLFRDIGLYVADSAAKSLVDNFLRDNVTPKVGSVLFCDLALAFEHSGIYIGNGEVVHLDGRGNVEIVSAQEFLGRLGGFNLAVSVYVSCIADDSVGSEEIAARAMMMVGLQMEYSVLKNNCHRFSAWCITGNSHTRVTTGTGLMRAARKELGVTTWRVWDI